MKKFLPKLIYFCIPIILYVLAIVIVDPYNFFNVSSVIDDKMKYDITNRSHDIKSKANMLWKVVKYNRDPKEKIIIGDSQGFYFREELIKELTGEDYFNFCVPAASFETTTDVFWYAAEKTKLKKVYYQVSFALSNSHFSYNLFDEASEIAKKPYLYISNKEILRESYAALSYKLTNNRKWVDDPYFERPFTEIDSISQRWAGKIFKDYNYPEDYIKELKKITAYCAKNNIELEFIVMPCFQWVNDYLTKSDMDVHQDKFFENIMSCGYLHNYAKLEDVTPQREMFYDYFHANQNVVDSITTLIWN